MPDEMGVGFEILIFEILMYGRIRCPVNVCVRVGWRLLAYLFLCFLK